MSNHRIEISISGKWVSVPALNFKGRNIVTSGKAVRLAMIHDEEWLETELDDPEACLEDLKLRGLPADIFTFAQKPPATTPQYNYPMEMESIAVACTASFQEWWESLPQETRKNVRRSGKRGVTVALRPFDDDLVWGIAEVNNESPLRQGGTNKHYGKTLDQVRKDHESFVERSDFVCAYVGDELIGYLKIVHAGKVASILNIVSKTRHQDKRPSNALIAKAVEVCHAKAVSHLIYGKYFYGNKRESPLLEFKIRNGFREIRVPRFYVPLTRWGEICIRLKLHLGLIEVLPPGIIAAGLRARMKWHRITRRWAGVAQG